jgi:hypothetical protein
MDRRGVILIFAAAVTACTSGGSVPLPSVPTSASDGDDRLVLAASKNDKVKQCVKKFIKAMEA